MRGFVVFCFGVCGVGGETAGKGVEVWGEWWRGGGGEAVFGEPPQPNH